MHKRLEKGIQNALIEIGRDGPKTGYAVNTYHVSMEMLAGVEDELYRRKQG